MTDRSTSSAAATAEKDADSNASTSAWASPRHTRAVGETASTSARTNANSNKRHHQQHRNRRRSHASTDSHSAPSEPQLPQHAPSLPDRIGAAALGGTMDLLKLTGGLALNTTGALVAPPLHVTRTILLPQLLAALKTVVADLTPRRLKDWFRILYTSLHHVVSVLQTTQRGAALRSLLVTCVVDVVELLTSDASRQVLLDSMSCWVKFAEAMNTPQTHAYLSQLAVTACRFMDALASGRSKRLAHDTSRLMQSLSQLVADPVTIVALAQVTAYIVYALEAEDAHLYDENENDEKNKTIRTAAQQRRRKERDEAQAQTYTSKYTTSDPDATVEQVILSSLGECDINGGGAVEIEQENDTVNNGLDAIPKNVEVRKQQQQSVEDDLQESWQPIAATTLTEMDDELLELRWDDKARTGVDVAYLHVHITERTRKLQEQEQMLQQKSAASLPKSRQPIVETVMDDEDGQSAADDLSVEIEELQEKCRTQKKNLKTQPRIGLDDTTTQECDCPAGTSSIPLNLFPDDSRLQALEGETSLDHFYRILDQTLEENRMDAFKSVLSAKDKESTTTSTENTAPLQQRGRVLYDPQNGNLDQINAKVPIKHMLNSLRGEIAEERRRRGAGATTGQRKYAWIGLFTVLVSLWIVLGCYGLYSLVNRPFQGQGRAPVGIFGQEDSGSPNQQELVIRVVREVVHVDKRGNVIDRGGHTATILDEKALDKLTQCVVKGL